MTVTVLEAMGTGMEKTVKFCHHGTQREENSQG